MEREGNEQREGKERGDKKQTEKPAPMRLVYQPGSLIAAGNS